MKHLHAVKRLQCKKLDDLINHYYAGSTAAFIKSEGGDDSNVSKMRRGLIPVASSYLPLIGCHVLPNKVA